MRQWSRAKGKLGQKQGGVDSLVRREGAKIGPELRHTTTKCVQRTPWEAAATPFSNMADNQLTDCSLPFPHSLPSVEVGHSDRLRDWTRAWIGVTAPRIPRRGITLIFCADNQLITRKECEQSLR